MRHASTWWPLSRLPSRRVTAALTSTGDAHRTTPPALPRPPTGTCAFTIQGPAPARASVSRASVARRAAGTAIPCSANSAFPSASISSTSVGSEAEDALVEVHVVDDLAPDQVAQRLRRPAADRAVARAAIEARHRVFV